MTVMEEEVTLKRKFAWWKVYKNGKWEYCHTAKRMTTDEALETAVPELKESIDERIKKVIKQVLDESTTEKDECYLDNGVTQQEVFAWLEKQGSQNLANSAKTCKVEPKFKVGDVIRNKWSNRTKTIIAIDNSQYTLDDGMSAQPFKVNINMQDNWEFVEQEPVDEVEPKFKAGDWITNGIDVNKIIGIDLKDENYLFENGRKSDISLCESISHIWTIQDAKDGDMLANDTIVLIVDHLGTFENKSIIYSWYFSDSNKFYGPGPSESDIWDVKGFHPATKEQCDLLFQKMKEAGYEWDAEKKELKKIEQNQDDTLQINPSEYINDMGGDGCYLKNTTQHPAWSEEDEQYLLVCKNALAKYQTTDKWDAGIISHWLEDKLKSLKSRVQPQPKQEWSEEDSDYFDAIIAKLEVTQDDASLTDNQMEFLKSLKSRYTWKPSEEQINALIYGIDDIKFCGLGSKRIPVLEELLQQLKKLTE